MSSVIYKFMYLGFWRDVSMPIRIIPTNSIMTILVYWLKCTCWCQSRVRGVARGRASHPGARGGVIGISQTSGRYPCPRGDPVSRPREDRWHLLRTPRRPTPIATTQGRSTLQAAQSHGHCRASAHRCLSPKRTHRSRTCPLRRGDATPGEAHVTARTGARCSRHRAGSAGPSRPPGSDDRSVFDRASRLHEV